jgi:hypothetical protein
VTFVAQCTGGPLDGELCAIPGSPARVLFLHRSIGPDGVVYVPGHREAPPPLRAAGVYRRTSDPPVDGRYAYRFDADG